MSAQQIIIEIVGKVDGLTPAIDQLEKLGKVDKEMAKEFRDSTAALQKQIDELKTLAVQSDHTAVSFEKLQSGIEGATQAYEKGLNDGITKGLEQSGVVISELRDKVEQLTQSQSDLIDKQKILEKQNDDLQGTVDKLNKDFTDQGAAADQAGNATHKLTLKQRIANGVTNLWSKGLKLLKVGLASLGIGALMFLLEALISNFDSIVKVVFKFIPGLEKLAKRFIDLKNVFTDWIGLTSEAERQVDSLREKMELYNKTLERNAKIFKARGEDKKAYEAERQMILNNIKVLKEWQKAKKLSDEEFKKTDEYQQLMDLYADLIVLDENYKKSLEKKDAAQQKSNKSKKEATKAVKDFHQAMKELNTEFSSSENSIPGLTRELQQLGHALFNTADASERAVLLEVIKDIEAQLKQLLSQENIEQIQKYFEAVNKGVSTAPNVISELEKQVAHLDEEIKKLSPDNPEREGLVQLFVELSEKLEEAREELDLLVLETQAAKLFEDPDFDIFGPFVEAAEEAGKKAREKLAAELEKLKEDIKFGLIDLGATVMEGFEDLSSQNLQQRFEEEQYYLDQSRDKELSNKELTEQQKAQIERRFAVEEARLRVKQFEAEKQMKLKQAKIDAAMAVVRLAAQTPPPDPRFFIGLAAIGAATGFQIAKINKEQAPPIPAYRKGTRYAKGGPSLVGEEGPEITQLPIGARVYTAKETAKVYDYLGAFPDLADVITGRMPIRTDLSDIKVGPSGISEFDYDRLGQSVAKYVKNETTTVNFNADAKGFGVYVKKGLSTVNQRNGVK